MLLMLKMVFVGFLAGTGLEVRFVDRRGGEGEGVRVGDGERDRFSGGRGLPAVSRSLVREIGSDCPGPSPSDSEESSESDEDDARRASN